MVKATVSVPVLTVQPGDVVYQHGYRWRVKNLYHGDRQVVLVADAEPGEGFTAPGGYYDIDMTLGYRPDMTACLEVQS